MENTLSVKTGTEKVKAVIFDILAIAFVYFVPALSHMLSFPVYLVEPMRLVIILSLIHFGKTNSYLIALTLPLFSFLIASHPSVIKSLLITSELLFNVFLFILISKRIKNVFITMLVSIAASKIFYYSVKYILLQAGAMSGSLVSTPLYIQAIVAFALSIYAFFMLKEKN